MNRIQGYIKAGFPLMNVVTPEEARAEAEIVEACKAIKRPCTVWSTTSGFLNKNGEGDGNGDPVAALTEIKKKGENQVYIFEDLQPFFQGQGGQMVMRLLRDIARDFKKQYRNLIMINPVNRIPPELERDVTLIEFDLPDVSLLGETWDMLCKENDDLVVKLKKAGTVIDVDERELIIQAARGLTTNEAENAFSKAIIETGNAVLNEKRKALVSTGVMREKALTVKKGGILQYFETPETMADVGGLGNLRRWMELRKSAFTKKAQEYGLENPRGILLVGIPGCGKSLGSKAIANLLGVPLIQFDISRVFAGLVGSSEANMRSALQTIDATAPNCVWVDEIEKGLAGAGGSGNTDSGVGQRVFGSLLTWMQEKKTPSFVVATLNRIEGLPPELLRKGRFDEIFYVGLPSRDEREEIFKIHLRKRKREPAKFRLTECVNESENFSGAEIEEAVKTAMYLAFSKGVEVNEDHILKSVMDTNPLAISKKGELDKMAEWASANAINASALPEKGKSAGRKLTI